MGLERIEVVGIVVSGEAEELRIASMDSSKLQLRALALVSQFLYQINISDAG